MNTRGQADAEAAGRAAGDDKTGQREHAARVAGKGGHRAEAFLTATICLLRHGWKTTLHELI